MKHLPWVIVMLLTLSQVACISDQEYSGEEVEALMQAELQRRLTNFRAVRSQRCYDEMLKEAIRQADSIMVVRAREAVPNPGRPGRPERPQQRQAKDSLPVKPLFERDSLLPDSTAVAADSTGRQ